MANWWTLKILSGPDAGKTFTLKRDRSVIGRVKGDVVLESDTELSSVHAEITFDKAKGMPILQDLRSRNGTRVNGEKIEKRALMPGDRVRFGITELVLEPPSSEETVVVANPNYTAPAPAANSEPPIPSPADVNQGTVKPQNAVTAAVAAATAAAASYAAKEEAPKSKFSGERVAPSLGDRFLDSLTPSIFRGYFSRLFGVLLHPMRFFDFLASENALIDGDKAYRTALKFGAINWLVGGVLSAVLSYYCTYVWKTTATGAGYGSNPFALAFETLAGFFVLPIVAVVYHWICLALGGKGPFKVAVRILCYISAVHILKDMASFIPKAGPFLTIALEAYIFYLFSLAATRLYYVNLIPAVASCAVSIGLAVTYTISMQHSAMNLQSQLVKLNPFLSGASFVNTSSGTPDTQVTVSTAVQPTAVQTSPVQSAATQSIQPQQRDPAATPEIKTSPVVSTDSEAETTTVRSDPTPPNDPAPPTSDPTPPILSPTSPTSPTSSDADPEPPKFQGQ